MRRVHIFLLLFFLAGIFDSFGYIVQVSKATAQNGSKTILLFSDVHSVSDQGYAIDAAQKPEITNFFAQTINAKSNGGYVMPRGLMLIEANCLFREKFSTSSVQDILNLMARSYFHPFFIAFAKYPNDPAKHVYQNFSIENFDDRSCVDSIIFSYISLYQNILAYFRMPLDQATQLDRNIGVMGRSRFMQAIAPVIQTMAPYDRFLEESNVGDFFAEIESRFERDIAEARPYLLEDTYQNLVTAFNEKTKLRAFLRKMGYTNVKTFKAKFLNWLATRGTIVELEDVLENLQNTVFLAIDLAIFLHIVKSSSARIVVHTGMAHVERVMKMLRHSHLHCRLDQIEGIPHFSNYGITADRLMFLWNLH